MGEWIEELGSDVSTDSLSVDRDPKILFLVVVRGLFVDSRYWTYKNDKRGGDQRKSGDLKMLIPGFMVDWHGELVRGKSYTGLNLHKQWGRCAKPGFSNG